MASPSSVSSSKKSNNNNKNNDDGNNASSTRSFRVAVIGGGITGACAASVLRSVSSRTKQRSKDDDDLLEPVSKHCQRMNSLEHNIDICVDLFDQGRSGVGGRSSHRRRSTQNDNEHEHGNEMSALRWDHGCQFFRADTELFQTVVANWVKHNVAKEWNGRFASDQSSLSENDFFGLPSLPPFFVGEDGMNSIPTRLLLSSHTTFNENMNASASANSSLKVFQGTRVARMERRDPNPENQQHHTATSKWHLFGTSGVAAFHDTSEKIAKQSSDVRLGRQTQPQQQQHQQSPQMDKNDSSEHHPTHDGTSDDGYDAVLLTDVSSSFGTWHRASAGVPENFATRVRDRVGARVPLFAVMIAFDEPLDIQLDAMSFRNNNVLWFAARNNSKLPPSSLVVDANVDLDPPKDRQQQQQPQSGNGPAIKDCWTLISTPEYAMKKIEETPMQDPKTGEFIPQSDDYLTTVPGPDLESAFREALLASTMMTDKTEGALGKRATNCKGDNRDCGATTYVGQTLPKTVYLDAQRWGSALPCHRHLDDTSSTRRTISGVPYDSHRSPLAPTKLEATLKGVGSSDGAADLNFLADDSLMLFQAGDMMSKYTPGYEGAAISGIEAAEHVLDILLSNV